MFLALGTCFVPGVGGWGGGVRGKSSKVKCQQEIRNQAVSNFHVASTLFSILAQLILNIAWKPPCCIAGPIPPRWCHRGSKGRGVWEGQTPDNNLTCAPCWYLCCPGVTPRRLSQPAAAAVASFGRQTPAAAQAVCEDDEQGLITPKY